MLTAVVVIEGLLILYLFLWRARQRQQVIVLTHFIWSLFWMMEWAANTDEKATHEQAYRSFVNTAAEEATAFTWVNPLAKFVKRGRVLFWDERYGRFATHAYKDYYERIASEWAEVQRAVAAREASKS